MRWSAARITSRSNVADHVTCANDITRPETSVTIEVRIIVDLPSRPEYVDDLSSKSVGSDAQNYSSGRADYGGAACCENVDTLM